MSKQNQKTGTKNNYKNGGMKAPDIAAMDAALKVKQYQNAAKSKNNINTITTPPESMRLG